MGYEVGACNTESIRQMTWLSIVLPSGHTVGQTFQPQSPESTDAKEAQVKQKIFHLEIMSLYPDDATAICYEGEIGRALWWEGSPVDHSDTSQL